MDEMYINYPTCKDYKFNNACFYVGVLGLPSKIKIIIKKNL